MQKIELTLSPSYVPTWTIADACRELFQNALDQESIDPTNVASWSYSDNTLRVSSATATLTTSSLLLGYTTKSSNSNTVGQFGEGYKIASLVLIRNQKTFTVYNYAAREVWRAKFVKSRKFNADILTFYIDKEAPWGSIPDNNLTIEIGGITQDEWDNEIVPSFLPLRTDYNVLHDVKGVGSIIDLPGKVFVKGLYVCDYAPYKYGYNFEPGVIALDRDRKMANAFELQWAASNVWAKVKSTDEILSMLSEECADVKYIDSHLNSTDFIIEDFVSTHGDKAIPVRSSYEEIPAGYKVIYVKGTYADILCRKITAPPVASTRDLLKSELERIAEEYNISDADVTILLDYIESL